jgi:carboxypeptidase family protein
MDFRSTPSFPFHGLSLSSHRRSRSRVTIARLLPAVLLCVLLCVAYAGAQTSNGVITGRVVDSTGAVIPGATVTLTSGDTGTKRDVISSETGDFVFTAIPPGAYTVTVELPGMKRLEKTNINLTGSERLPIGDLALQVGAVSDSVTVEAEGTVVQTQSAEGSAVLTPSQVQTLATLTREVVGLTRTMPGVVVNQASGQRFSDDSAGAAEVPRIGGLRQSFASFTMEGVSMVTPAGMSTVRWPTNMDSIGEVKVLLNNYAAEYGRTGGAMVNLVGKGGTRDFHGTAYIYRRHEQFNANDFFNNRDGLEKARYRYGTYGFSVGGPVVLPGGFNKNRDKLFFFFSNETLRDETPRPLNQSTMPTALERAGNFSQTLDTNGRLIVIRDPLTNQPFQGNIIPANRIDPNGQRILSLFPLPNITDRGITGGNYNFNFQESWTSPKQDNTLRVDANLTSKMTAYVRYNLWRDGTDGYGIGGCNTGGPTWGYFKCQSRYDAWTATVATTYVISPTLVHEFQLAGSFPHNWILNVDDLSKMDRTKLGLTIPQLFTNVNKFNMPPLSTFAGVPNAAQGANMRGDYPKSERHRMFNLTDSISWIHGPHTYKFGIAADETHIGQGLTGAWSGTLAFGRDANNPNDSNYAYANAILGNFISYSQVGPVQGTRREDHGGIFEWFAQDNWKFKKLTLDYGIRWSYITPEWEAQTPTSAFEPNLYDPKKAPVLYQPALNGGQRVALNPLTGQFAPLPYIGAFVPNSGDVINGMLLRDGNPNYPFNTKSFTNNPGLKWGPRFGFAYDLFGDGKTALRGGGGIMYTWKTDGADFSIENPPARFSPTIYYSNLASIGSATAVSSPASVTGIQPDLRAPVVYNFSLNVQRNVGFGTVVSVGYVGNLARHLVQVVNINQLPYGTRFLASSLDKTTGKPLPDNFLRPYSGYGDINIRQNVGSSNYNAMQVQANRRFAKRLQFGVSWSWSKSLDYGSGDRGVLPTYADRHSYSYGLSDFDRPRLLSITGLWSIPSVSHLWNNGITRGIFDNWQISAIGDISSGAPQSVTFTTVDNSDLTGGGDPGRVVMVCNPTLSSGQTINHMFDTSCFKRPALGDPGNSPRNVVRGGGTNNWDLSFLKDIPVREKVKMQFRWEMFNAFNHTQWGSMDTAARFDAAGNQVNPRFGAIIDAKAPRKMQGSLRISF